MADLTIAPRLRSAILRSWLETTAIPGFDGRILPVDERVARLCARLHVPNPRFANDAFIAATALAHNLVLVTRNIVDFTPIGVTLINPWEVAG